jgi:hypothetical protein
LSCADDDPDQLKAIVPARARAERKLESIERPVERMRKRLTEGGEVAQSALRELCPRGIWLEPNPFGGSFLWATAVTACPADGPHLYAADGTCLPGSLPVVYRHRCDQDQELVVAGARYFNFRRRRALRRAA